MPPLPGGLLPCPFCRGGETRLDETRLWGGGLKESALVSVVLRHHCEKGPGCVGAYREVRGRDLESAVRQWNLRLEAERAP